MGLLDFARDAGHKLGIGKGSQHTQESEKAKKAAEAAKAQAAADAEAKAARDKAKAITDAAQKAAAEQAAKEAAERAAKAKAAADAMAAEARAESNKSEALEQYVTTMGLNVSNLDIRFNDGCAYVLGDCPSEADKEKLILAVGNVAEVGRVIDTINVSAPADTSQYYTVVSGDNLSKIAKHYYGEGSKYPVIFEANKPMLKDPDEIFPGQILRIPALETA